MASPEVIPAELGVFVPFGLDRMVWDGGMSTGAGMGLEEKRVGRRVG